MRNIRIFISSPGDVEEERERARQVIEGLRRRYARHFFLKPVLWEDLPLQADMSFQEGIDLVLSAEHGIDVAVFILWSRMGELQDIGQYRSGTEREFDLMRAARDQSDPENRRPALFVYTRSDDASFEERLRGKVTAEQQDLLEQKATVERFIEETFQDQETGQNLRAFHQFDRPVSFSQRLRAHLTEYLDELAGGLEEIVWDTEKKGAPFMGLEAFQPEHADVFFGREGEILEARRALREQAANGCAFLMLSGASGSGKSSLARAGVAPAIAELELDDRVGEWRTLIVTPSELGSDPIEGLVRRLAGEELFPALRGGGGQGGEDLEDVISGLKRDPELTFRLRLKEVFAGGGGDAGESVRLLLVLDQLEEFFTGSEVTEEHRRSFFETLEALARSGRVWILATVRSDFYQQVQGEEALVRMKAGNGQLDVLPPGPDALSRLIEEPARLAGLRFEEKEGRSLSDRILEEAADHAELLPLVEFVLRELYEGRTGKGQLTYAAYEKMGEGIECGTEGDQAKKQSVILGSLAKRAEDVFRSLPDRAQDSLGDVLQKLVTLGHANEDGSRLASESKGDERLVRQHVPISEIETSNPDARELISRFVAARMFTTSKGSAEDEDEAVVCVAHESLIRVWPRAVRWAEQNREFLRTRARVAARMKEGSPLLKGDPLMESARAHLALTEDGFSTEQSEYIRQATLEAEARECRAARRRRVAILGMTALTLVALAGGTWALKRERDAEAARKVEETARKDAEEARQLEEQARKDAEVAEQKATEAKQEILESTAELNNTTRRDIIRRLLTVWALDLEASEDPVDLALKSHFLKNIERDAGRVGLLKLLQSEELHASNEKRWGKAIELPMNEPYGGTFRTKLTWMRADAKKYPLLIHLILQTESMDDAEKQYWFDILPSMTVVQKLVLIDILTNEYIQLLAVEEKYLNLNRLQSLSEKHQTEYINYCRKKFQKDPTKARKSVFVEALISGREESGLREAISIISNEEIEDEELFNLFASSLDNLADVLFEAERFGEAARTYEKLNTVWRVNFDSKKNRESMLERLRALRNAGISWENAEDPTQAERRYREALAFCAGEGEVILDDEIMRQETTSIRESLASLFYDTGRFSEAVFQRKSVVGLKHQALASAIEDAEKEMAKEDLSDAYGVLCWSQIFAEDFSGAVTSCEAGITVLPQVWLEVNLAHALLLSGQFDRARKIHLRNRGIQFEYHQTWEQAIQNDFTAFRKAGIDIPGMAKIETLLGIEASEARESNRNLPALPSQQ